MRNVWLCGARFACIFKTCQAVHVESQANLQYWLFVRAQRGIQVSGSTLESWVWVHIKGLLKDLFHRDLFIIYLKPGADVVVVVVNDEFSFCQEHSLRQTGTPIPIFIRPLYLGKCGAPANERIANTLQTPVVEPIWYLC